MGRPVTCTCGECEKCKRRVYMRGWYRRHAARERERALAFRLRNIERVRAQDRARGFRPGDPAKKRARRAVATALANGSLTREPCSVCGVDTVQAHHADYQKPLEVEWLCSLHHGAAHRSFA